MVYEFQVAVPCPLSYVVAPIRQLYKGERSIDVTYQSISLSHLLLAMEIPLRSHLSVLETSASLFSSSPAFQIPRSDLQLADTHDWEPITYAQFYRDVEVYASHWHRVLT